MIDQITPDYNFPNNMGRILLLSMKAILGTSGINAVLNLADLPQLIHNYPLNNHEDQFD